jgi:uncharacterized protein (DUF302 family)
MNYYFSRQVSDTFENVRNRTIEVLKSEGFGIITEIDVRDTMKKKLDVDFKKYNILGACNPSYAFQALQAEDKIGTMLPCNVLIIEVDAATTEVAAINPLVSMQSVNNPGLNEVAQQVTWKLKRAVESV